MKNRCILHGRVFVIQIIAVRIKEIIFSPISNSRSVVTKLQAYEKRYVLKKITNKVGSQAT